MSKEITVPSPIVPQDQLSGAVGNPVTIREWAFLCWLPDPRWHRDLSRLIIVTGEFNKKTGEKMFFEDADYALLEEIVRAPQCPQQNPLLAIQMESFKHLILKAGSPPSQNAK